MPPATIGRREVLLTAAGALIAPLLLHRTARAALPSLRVTGFELLPVRATRRTVWLFVRLGTSTGLTGLGEASDAFGFANTTAADAATMRSQLATFFALVEGRSPFDIAAYRQRGEPLARNGLVAATAFSAIEQALWDLAGKALDVPAHTFFGGSVQPVFPYTPTSTAPPRRARPPASQPLPAGRRPTGFAPSRPRRSTVSLRLDHLPLKSTPPPTRASPVSRPCVKPSDRTYASWSTVTVSSTSIGRCGSRTGWSRRT